MSTYDEKQKEIDEDIKFVQEQMKKLEADREAVPWDDVKLNRWRRNVQKQIYQHSRDLGNGLYDLERRQERQLDNLHDSLNDRLSWIFVLMALTWIADIVTLIMLISYITSH